MDLNSKLSESEPTVSNYARVSKATFLAISY